MNLAPTNMDDQVPVVDKADSFIMESSQPDVGVKIAVSPVDSDNAVATAPVLGDGILRGAIPQAHKSERRKITHVLFDMDGLLLDTERFYTTVQIKILERFGKTFDWKLKSKMIGKAAIEAARIFVDETGLEGQLTAEEFLEEREEMLAELFPDANLLPGVERLLRHLAAKEVPMAVATSSHKRHYELKTTKHKEVFTLFHHVVTGDDPAIKKGKPAPDIFETAASRFDPPAPAPENVLVFEDAPSGVRAARAAEMSVIMIPDENLDPSLHQGANEVLKSMEDFQPQDWGLPPFDQND